MGLTLDLGKQEFCYLTTIGRRSGKLHQIEIWFAMQGGTIYMLAGGGQGADWVRNLIANSRVTVKIADRVFVGHARVADAPDEDALARDVVTNKYQPGYAEDLASWKQTALPVAVDLQ